VPDRVVFEKLIQILVFGCAYWRIADEQCSATTLRRRRNEWIEEGAMDTLEELAREAYDRAIGLDPYDVAVDCCITKAPCGGERAGKSPVDRGKVGIKRSMASHSGLLPSRPIAMTHRFWQRLWTPWRPASREGPQRGRVCIWTAATIRRLLASAWRNAA
jgi:hypothetical protein